MYSILRLRISKKENAKSQTQHSQNKHYDSETQEMGN